MRLQVQLLLIAIIICVFTIGVLVIGFNDAMKELKTGLVIHS